MAFIDAMRNAKKKKGKGKAAPKKGGKSMPIDAVGKTGKEMPKGEFSLPGGGMPLSRPQKGGKGEKGGKPGKGKPMGRFALAVANSKKKGKKSGK